MLYRDYLKDKYQNAAVKLANAEGVPCVMEYSKGKNLRNYEIYGNSVQDGTPTPESPVEIQSVGDLTKNLLSYPYNYTTRTENGLTFTDNGDGSIKINGTATNRTGFMFRNQIIDIIDKTKAYVLSGGKDGNVVLRIDFYNGTKWKNLVDTGNDGKAIIDFTKMNFDYTRVSVSLVVKANTVCDNITIKPQLELGETATEYEPYHKYAIPITVTGKNLFDMETILPQQGWVKQDDGSYYVAKASTPYQQVLWENTENYIGQLKILFKVKYSIDNKHGCYLWVNYTDGTYLTVYYKGTVVADTWYSPAISTTITDASKTVQNIIWVYGTTANSTWVKDIIITKDTTVTEYEPYKGSITEHIYLNEPLRKVGDYADYIDFKNQKVIRKVKEITFENIKFNEYSYGTALDNTYHFYIRSMSCILSSSMFCNIMKAGDFDMNNAVDDSFFTSRYSNQGNGGIYLQIEKSLINGYSGESNAEKLKAFLIDKNAKLLYCTTEYSEEHISLPALKTFKGTNVMSVDTSVQPSNIKAKYVRL